MVTDVDTVVGAAVEAAADFGAGAGAVLALAAELADAADRLTGRAVPTGGAEEAGVEPAELALPGRNANMRKSVMANPVCSSGASDKSGRLVIAI